ncbi:MAG TPA: sulfatase-like hydrolase/transferase, partial [Spirillospora sp.]|nr:sulfatase-like hydrolase/transferase [Spirillospora sp.]
VSSVIVLLFFAYGRVFEVTQHIRLRFFPFDKHPGLLALWGILAAAGIAFAVRFPRRLPGINWVVGLFASLLLIVSFAEIGVKAATNSAPPLPVYEAALDVSAPDVLPDIYFIVLDEYAGNRALLDYLGYDNSEFTDSLRDRGFYVADAHANYYATRFSLASILNMHYLDSLYGHRGEDPEPVIAQVRDNVTIQTLKRLGYTYVHFNSGSRVTRDNPFVDILYDGYDEQRIRLGDLLEIDPKQFHITDFHITLGQTTLLRPLMEMEQLRDSRSRVLFSLEKLTELPRMPEPTFAFAHLVLPHPPYVFGRDEGPVNPDRPVDGQIVDEALYQAHAGYIDQVIYTNRAISQLVDTILEQSATEPIILIQADHGFRWLCSDCLSESKAWDDAYYSDVVLPILSAYYLPDGGDSQLYPTMSPVNTFRVIFDHYFGADLVLLEDRYFRPEDYFTRPYFFIDITHRVVASRNLN